MRLWKNVLAFRDLAYCKGSLRLRMWTEFRSQADSVPIYLESLKKLYLPKHYGIDYFGNPDFIKATSRDSIELEFNDTYATSSSAVGAFLTSCEERPLTEKVKAALYLYRVVWKNNHYYTIYHNSRKRPWLLCTGVLSTSGKNVLNNTGCRVGIIQGSSDIKNRYCAWHAAKYFYERARGRCIFFIWLLWWVSSYCGWNVFASTTENQYFFQLDCLPLQNEKMTVQSISLYLGL